MIKIRGQKSACTKREIERKNIYCLSVYVNIYIYITLGLYRRQKITRQAVYLYCNIDASSCNNCCCGKGILITFSVCVSLALFMQYVKCMRHIILPSVTCPAVP